MHVARLLGLNAACMLQLSLPLTIWPVQHEGGGKLSELPLHQPTLVDACVFICFRPSQVNFSPDSMHAHTCCRISHIADAAVPAPRRSTSRPTAGT